ncbi:MAG: hypothetical protein H7343_18895 [Undibacterium sp.]|nr:hypothetical protein [Opitutaceae bacterium]
MSDQHRTAAFAPVQADPAQPHIVGGQAANPWAEIYVASEPELTAFEPFTSKDADIHGNRELAAILQRRSGWTCRFFDEPRQTFLPSPAMRPPPPLPSKSFAPSSALTPTISAAISCANCGPAKITVCPIPS